MKIIVFLIVVILNALPSYGNIYSPNRIVYNTEDTADFKIFTNKVVVSEFKTQTYSALAFYPELKDTRIVFIYKKIKTSMACRPKLISIFQRKNKRIFNIYINNDSIRLKNAILCYVPFRAQVGVIGHELAHIIDYQSKSIFGILKTGIGYLFTKSKSKLEKKVDVIAVKHGLKKNLIEFSDYILNQSNASENYKNYKRKIYYTPLELDKL